MDIDAVAAQSAFPEFEIESEPLGQGGMKVAFLGSSSGQPVVLKIVREPIPTDEERDAFAIPERIGREIEAMARLESPAIVRVLNGPEVRQIGDTNHLWYLEPFYDGGSLDKHLGKPWEQAGVVRLMTALFDAIEAMKMAGIVHRDIKPQNIVLDGDGSFVLLDLGIALVLDLTPLTAGWDDSPKTRLYASPEQFEPRRKATIDFRTDLFLTGIVAFEALTGVHPFKQNDVEGFVGRVLDGEIDEPALAAVKPSKGLEELIRRLLAPSPSLRFRSMEQARRALDGCE